MREVGCPLKDDKTVNLTRLAVWLGFEVDSALRQIRVPAALPGGPVGRHVGLAGGGETIPGGAGVAESGRALAAGGAVCV